MEMELFVGLLSELKRESPQDYHDIKREFIIVDKILQDHGLPIHHEPEDLDDDEYFEAELDTYGLHCFKRIAAYLAIKETLPEPMGDDDPYDDVVEEYFETMYNDVLPFMHIMDHSDIDGLYLPASFDTTIMFPENDEFEGYDVASSERLKEECEEIAGHLGIDVTMDPWDEMIDQAYEHGDTDDTLWKKYPIETHVCLVLYNAAVMSINTGSAIIFAS